MLFRSKPKEIKKNKEAGYKYIVRTYSATNSEGKEYVLDLGGKFVDEIFIRTRPDNGNTVFAGMYSTQYHEKWVAPRTTGILKGFFYMEIRQNGTVASKYIKEIKASQIKNISKTLLFEKGKWFKSKCGYY